MREVGNLGTLEFEAGQILDGTLGNVEIWVGTEGDHLLLALRV